MSEIDLLGIERGLVVAPAGCGKTHAIVDAVQRHTRRKPILVLTHTNAGVAALRQRLNRLGVPRSAYRLSTIDGWAMRLVSMFPTRAAYGDGPSPAKPDYNLIRTCASRLLRAGHVSDIIQASYARLIVDEYQDCSVNQHHVASFLAESLPTVVLGDPLQSIFGFKGDPLADWRKDVCTRFPPSATLATPWRWRNAGNEELGFWLLDLRSKLEADKRIDLETAPKSVRWAQLNGDAADHSRLIRAARCDHRSPGETNLVIGDSKSAGSRFRIARSVPGMVTIEPVALQDALDFADMLTLGDGSEVDDALQFAETVVTNVDREGVLKRLATLSAGKERRTADDVEQAALRLEAEPSCANVAELLSACTRRSEARVYRPTVLRACLRALQMSASNPAVSFKDAMVRVREENRAVGRQLPTHAIGSTLLLKGLEADHVVVLNAGALDRNNLYVAMSRGAKTITVCSRANALAPV